MNSAQSGLEVKKFFMLNSDKHENCPVNKSQITNNCNIAEHKNFSVNKYQNANNSYLFYNLFN